MGGNSASTTMPNGSQLSQLFGQSAGYGYSQPNQVAPISQPQLPTPILPTPQQAALATQARLQARMPMAAPTSAPRTNSAFDAANRQVIQQNLGLSGRGNR